MNMKELSPEGKRIEARAHLLNMWRELLRTHDALDLNDPESSAIGEVVTLIADKLEAIEGKRPRRDHRDVRLGARRPA